MLISILICTRDRAAKLKRTLEAISCLEVPPGADYEVLLIENGRETSSGQADSNLAPVSMLQRLRILRQPEPGKSRAANAGFAICSGEIIAFLDDDILPRQDWLAEIYREFSTDPSVAAISGQVSLLNTEDLPIAIRQKKERAFFSCPGDAYSLFIGCNFAVRRSILEKVGLFDPRLGPGRPIGTNEDVDLFYRLWRTRQKLVYVPSLYVYHDHGRRSKKDEVQTTRAYIIGRGAFFAKYILRGDKELLRTMRWEIQSELRNASQGEMAGIRRLGWLLFGFCRYALNLR